MNWKQVITGAALVATVGWVGIASASREFEYGASGKVTAKRYYCGSGSPHTGGPSMDIHGNCGQCIYASRGGTSRYYGGCGSSCANYAGGKTCNGGAGNYMQVYHSAGYKTRYLHGLSGSQRTGTVTDSQKVIKMGATGLAGHVHLHFDIWRNGVKMTSWVDTLPACNTSVRAGNHIPYSFPGLTEGTNTHTLYGCN